MVQVRATAESGLGKDFLPLAELLKTGTMTQCGKKALSQAGVVVTKHPHTACTDCPLSGKYRGRGAMTVRLEHSGTIFGLLSVSIPRQFLEDQEELFLFHDVAGDLPLALHSEEALRESESQKEALLDASIDRIRLVDADMRIIWANRTTTRELAITPEDIVGKVCYQVLREQDVLCPGCPTEKALESGRIEHSVMHHVSSKGFEGETWWDAYAVPIKDEEGRIVRCIQISRNITDAKKKELRITQSLKEKEFLLKEIHHRVKNNMQVIASLLKLQAAAVNDERLLAPFQDAENRVRAMSLVHEKLYQSEDFTKVPFRDYLTSLIRYLSQSYEHRARHITVVAEIEDLPLDITAAIPCGLIVNELLSNAFKHAFPGERVGMIASPSAPLNLASMSLP